MLSDGKTEDVLTGRKLKPETTGIMTQLFFLNQLQRVLGVGICNKIYVKFLKETLWGFFFVDVITK